LKPGIIGSRLLKGRRSYPVCKPFVHRNPSTGIRQTDSSQPYPSISLHVFKTFPTQCQPRPALNHPNQFMLHALKRRRISHFPQNRKHSQQVRISPVSPAGQIHPYRPQNHPESTPLKALRSRFTGKIELPIRISNNWVRAGNFALLASCAITNVDFMCSLPINL